MLNQAAREVLLAQTSIWPRMVFEGEDVDYARRRLEIHLRNFTTIYEALGNSRVNTRWLTSLEQRDTVFPNINYSVFRRRTAPP